MGGFSEMNTKVEISIGLIMFLIGMTFAGTRFYIKQSTLEERMDKRYKRTEQRIDQLEKHLVDE